MMIELETSMDTWGVSFTPKTARRALIIDYSRGQGHESCIPNDAQIVIIIAPYGSLQREKQLHMSYYHVGFFAFQNMQ